MLQFQDFGGDGTGDAAGVFVAQGVRGSGGIVSIVITDTCTFVRQTAHGGKNL